ncbi:TonB-dependent receptor [Maribellus comscasis]|nr:TonB-dependent receptor [Maribellus comscasis]
MKNCFLFISATILACFIVIPSYSQQLYTIRGNVFNEENNEPVINANIVVVKTKIGTSTNEGGDFELSLRSGEYKIKITSVGFSTKEIKINIPLENNELVEIGLQPKKQEIESVDVYGNFILQERDTAINMVPLSVLPAITKVSAVDIEKQGAVTLTDALKYVPGGWTETRGRKSKQFFSVRGQKYPYPDYSIDGVWQKEFEETAYALSAFDIESVEIIRSSNALVKGLSGLTGVIEVKTRKPKRETASLLTKYGESNNYVANLQYGNKINDISFNTALAFFGTTGIPDRGGKERVTNFHGNMNWEISRRMTLVTGVTAITGMREFIGIIEPGSPKILNREEKFDPLHTWITYAKLNYRGNKGTQTELQTNFSFRDANYENYNIQQETTTTHHDKDWEYGFNLLHSRFIGHSNTFSIGTLYSHWVAPDGKRYYAGRRCDVNTWSGVIADEQKFGRILLDAGFRLIGGYINEWGGFGIEGSAAGFQDVPSITNESAPIEWQSAFGLNVVQSPVSSIHYNFSGGTVAPRKGSVTAQGTTPQNEGRMQHNLGLRIKSQNIEEITISTFFTQRKNALDLSGETAFSENDIIVELYENKDKRSYGIELAAQMNIPIIHSSVFGNTTFMKNEKVSDNKMVDDKKLPNVILNGGFMYEHSGVDANLFIHYTGPYFNNRFVDPKWTNENGDYPLGDFVKVDFNCGYTFSGKIKTRIFMEVKNLLNKKYETVAGYPDQGRLFLMGVKLDY